MEKDMVTAADVVAQMKLLLDAVPARPRPSEVEEATVAIREEERLLTVKLEELYAQPCPSAVPPPVFRALQELHEGVIRTQSDVRKRRAVFVLQLEERHRLFEDLLRKAELAVETRDTLPGSFSYTNHIVDSSNDDGRLHRSLSGPLSATKEKAKQLVSEPGGLVARTYEEGRSLLSKKPTYSRSPSRSSIEAIANGGNREVRIPLASANHMLDAETSTPLSADQEEELGLRWPPNLLDILETAERGGRQPENLNFSNGGYNWLPDSIGMLVNLKSLDLSGNQLVALPDTIGDLVSLTDLDLEANLLKSIPDSIGNLTSLRKLNMEKNSIEEIPWTIGGCTSLVELRADFNQLKALPEAIGQLRQLTFLSVHLNCLKSLPTTMSSLTNLTDLFVHFNHLETLPESLCSLTSLTRLNASSNFAEFRRLPPQIGNLQGLRDLDLSFNHITVLPDSFALLTNLRRLNLDGNPWRIPPLEVVAEGKEAVLEYMARWRERDQQTKKKTSSWNIFALVLKFIGKCKEPRTTTEDKFSKITA